MGAAAPCLRRAGRRTRHSITRLNHVVIVLPVLANELGDRPLRLGSGRFFGLKFSLLHKDTPMTPTGNPDPDAHCLHVEPEGQRAIVSRTRVSTRSHMALHMRVPTSDAT